MHSSGLRKNCKRDTEKRIENILCNICTKIIKHNELTFHKELDKEKKLDKDKISKKTACSVYKLCSLKTVSQLNKFTKK